MYLITHVFVPFSIVTCCFLVAIFVARQAPLETLMEELKASASAAFSGRGVGGKGGSGGLPYTSLAFQQKFASEVLGSPVAEQFPPRLEYVSRLTKVQLLGESSGVQQEGE